MISVALSRGYVAVLDDEDGPLIAGHHWYAHVRRRTVYARASCGVLMHRLILVTPGDIDHLNRDGLDNRRENLREAVGGINRQNAPADRDNRAGYRGVSRHWRQRRWRARIERDGAKLHLGQFDTPEEAARAYDCAALRIYGSNAYTNFAPAANGTASAAREGATA